MRGWIVIVLALATGCHRAKDVAPDPAKVEAAPRVSTAAAPPAEALPPPARVEKILVPGDLPASVVRGKDARPPLTVFMPGVCSNGGAYLQTFPEAARTQGGVVAIEGDQPCQPGFRTFSWDAAKQHARIEAALAAAGVREIPSAGITLVGYSQGASLAEQMLQRWPQRYTKVVLIGAPTDPAPRTLARAESLVTMACDRDGAAPRMRQAAKAAQKLGVPSTYIEMPGCSHGNITEGEATFSRTFDWLRENARTSDVAPPPTLIVGQVDP